MLNCKEVVRRSSDYVDRNLSAWERVSYKLHLLMCVHCRRYIQHFTVAIGVSRECAKSPLSDEQADAVSKQASGRPE